MSSGEVDEALFARARAAMTAARAAEHALLEVVGELAETGAWTATGHRTLPRALTELWRINDGHARRLVRHAAAVLPMMALSGEALEERLPSAAAASSAGEIGDEHLTVLVKAVSAVERIAGITPDQVTAAEEILGQAARTLTPSGLEKAVARLLATLDPDGAAPDHGGEPGDEWQLVVRKDGTLAFTGRIHAAADVALLLETLDALSDPAGPDDDRSLAARRAEALLDLCAHALGCAGRAALDDTDDTGDDPDDDEARVDDGDGEHRMPRGTERHGTGHSNTDDGQAEAAQSGGDESEHGEPGDSEPGDSEPGSAGPEDAGPEESESEHGESEPGESEHGDGDDEARDREPDETTPEGDGPDDPPQGHLRLVPEPEPDPPSSPTPRQRGQRLPISARAAVTVTIPLDWLREQRGHMLIDDTPADIAAARRLACDAKIIPAVLGSRGEPLDVGRAAYAVPLALWRALILRDRGCAHPGCRRRASRTHAHHIWHWLDGGPTSLENTVLLCRYHHHLVHEGGWEITMIDGRPWFTPPSWIDPHRQPRPGGPLLPAPRRDAA